MLSETRIQINTLQGQVPALILHPSDSKGVVLVYHGLSADKEVQRKEMHWLADAGFTAVGIDAPHHGERRDSYLNEITSADSEHAHYLVIKMVDEAIGEIPDIVKFCRNNLSENAIARVGITGISLGGYIAYGAVIAESTLDASVPILGSPDWRSGRGGHTKEMDELLKRAPVHYPEKFFPCAIFASNASKDIYVPTKHSKDFMERLMPEYESHPHRLQYIEYPESEHMMREQDWYDLWHRVITWFDRFLNSDE